MTQEEKEIGAKWLGILAIYSNDFATKSLFNQTTAYLKTNGNGKKQNKFRKEEKPATVLNENVKPEVKRMSLLDAAKQNEFSNLEDDEPNNLLAIDETGTDLKPKRGRKKNA